MRIAELDVEPSTTRRRSDPGELGQDVHDALRTTGAFRGFTSARVRISPRARCGVRERACESPQQPGRTVLFRPPSFGIGGGETDQLALAITGGYRARFPHFTQEGTAAGRNGMYVAANYPLPARSPPRRLQCDPSIRDRPDWPRVAQSARRPPLRSSGTRRRMAAAWPSMLASRSSSIAGTSALVWAASRTGSTGRRSSDTTSAFRASSAAPSSSMSGCPPPTRRVDSSCRSPIPAMIAYHRERWSVLSEYSHGFMANQFRAGLEYRLGAVEREGQVATTMAAGIPQRLADCVRVDL